MDFLKKNFKTLRELNGLNQAQLCISLGFSRGAWNNYETGKSKPNIDVFLKISKFFGYSASDLLEKDLEFAHLNKIDITKNEAINAHLNQYLNAHPNAKKAKVYANTEDLSPSMVMEDAEPYLREKSANDEAKRSNIVVESLSATNAYLLSRVAALEAEVTNLKKEKFHKLASLWRIITLK